VDVAARVGAHFIGSGRARRCGTGEAGGRQWCGFNSRPFRGVQGGGELTGAELVRESEGGQTALRFGSIRVREGGRRWHATRRRGRMDDDDLGFLRKGKGPGWAGAGPQRPGGSERSGGLKMGHNFGLRQWDAEMVFEFNQSFWVRKSRIQILSN
jgi:hypothetical protein